jgi:hypothetical protein
MPSRASGKAEDARSLLEERYQKFRALGKYTEN